MGWEIFIQELSDVMKELTDERVIKNIHIKN